MKIHVFYLIAISSLFTNCIRQNKRINNIEENIDAFNVSKKDSNRLTLLDNPDTVMANKIIRDKSNDVLLIFTGWQISSKTLLCEEFCKDPELLRLLRNYKILTFYVDDKTKGSNDSSTIGYKNMTYQRRYFNSVTQPYYILYSKGVKKCEHNYLPDVKSMIVFLDSCM